jgi:hypothetical protein
MNCALCECTSYLGLNLMSGKYICFACVLEIRKFKVHAPNPHQEQPGNYFPQIGAANVN